MALNRTRVARSAATVAGDSIREVAVPLRRPITAAAWEALRYVFVYVRGRLDAEDRKRKLVDERDGTRRMLESAHFDLGQNVLKEAPTESREITEIIASLNQARLRREHAIADLTAAEKQQAASDLRLGIEQSNAETEWKACESRAGEIDKLLHDLESERRQAEDEARRLQNPSPGSDLAARGLEIAALEKKRAALSHEYGALRERAAALRATTVAARAKFDQTTTTRRTAASEMAASLSAHARARSEAEARIRELTLLLGRASFAERLERPTLLPAYAHIARLETAIAEHDRLLTGIQHAIGGYDTKKLALGAGLLISVLAALGAGVWVLLRAT